MAAEPDKEYTKWMPPSSYPQTMIASPASWFGSYIRKSGYHIKQVDKPF